MITQSTTARFFLGMFIWVSFLFPSTGQAIDVIDVRMSPSTPDAYEMVVVRLISFTTDLAASQIIWTIDGSVVSEGPAQTEFSVRAGGYGETVNLAAEIFTPRGQRIAVNAPISPIGIDILWEAQGYTPPFYKGKARPTVFSKVKVAAFPRFNTGADDPARYIYTWFIRENTKVGEGLGRNSAIIESPRVGQNIAVRLEVATPDRRSRGDGRLSFQSDAPLVRFYEHAPLLGLRLENALGAEGLPISTETAIIRVVPYFLSKEAVDAGNIRVGWSIDGVGIPSGIDPLEIVVEAPERSGTRSVRADIENRENLFQSAEGGAPVVFLVN